MFNLHPKRGGPGDVPCCAPPDNINEPLCQFTKSILNVALTDAAVNVTLSSSLFFSYSFFYITFAQDNLY